jgi:hypothetical protein
LWLQHPSYVPLRDRLIDHLQSTRYRFRRLAPVVFLCGGKDANSRETLRRYFRKHNPDLSIFYAERVWELMVQKADRDALQMEAELAFLADIVVIIVESPGTFAELGAFSLSEPLRKKLLPIIDVEYRDQPSFISNGPVRWIDKDSDFKPTIYVPLPKLLQAVDQIEERITRIPESHGIKISDLATSPKHLLFFLCDLISVIHPATVEMIEYYLGRIAPSTLSSSINVSTLVGLGEAMSLLRADQVTTGERKRVFFSPSSPGAVERPFHHSRLLDLQGQRAAHVSVLLTIPQARGVLADIAKVS